MDPGRVFFLGGGWSPDSAIIRHHQILTLAGSDVVPLDFLFRKFGILGKAAARPQIALGFGLAWGFEPSWLRCCVAIAFNGEPGRKCLADMNLQVHQRVPMPRCLFCNWLAVRKLYRFLANGSFEHSFSKSMISRRDL